MTEERGNAKQQTILELTEQILKQLGDFRTAVDAKTARNQTGDPLSDEMPRPDNQLDEIIVKLESASSHLSDIAVNVGSKILTKLS